MKQMKANNAPVFKALTALVDYLNKEVKRTSKCNQCQYKGKSFHGEPCYWHVDCGIEDCDKKASDNAMYLLKRFKLQKALIAPPRNCDVYSYDEALKIWAMLKENKQKRCFDEWLYAPATERCTRA